jgi:hypothetical protein
MIRLDTLTDLVTAPGPFATAYLDATRAEELGPQIVVRRWRALRAQLADQGADDATLDAMEGAVGGHDDVPGAHGQALVGSGGAVRWDVALPAPPRRDTARFSALPHLMPAVAALGPREPYVVALVDRVGADITVHGPAGQVERSVDGGTYPIHKTGLGGWAAQRYERRAEDLWEANAKQVAEVLAVAVRRVGAAVVVVAGDVRAREALRSALPKDAADLVVELDTGGRAPGVDSEKLDAGIAAAVARVAADRDRAELDRFAEAYGRAKAGIGDVLAVAGFHATVDALRQGQVETLLIVDEPDSEARAWIGPEPTQLGLTADEVSALGVDAPAPERLDAALIRAVAGTDAAVVTLAPGQLDVPDGLAATLRFPRPAQ